MGVTVAANPGVSTSCGGSGAPIALAGATTVTLPAGRTIPANGSCTLTVTVTSAVTGTYFNTLLAGSLVTSAGVNAAAAIATLTVIGSLPPPVPFIPVPAIDGFGLLLLGSALMLTGLALVRRQSA